MPRITTAAVLTLALIAPACDDPTDVPDHIAADGIAIYEGDAELFRYTRADGFDIPGLTLTVGPHDVRFVLLGPDGEPMIEEGHEEGAGDPAEPEPGEHDHALIVSIADPDLLRWEPEPHGGEEHEFIEFHGLLNALAPGTTTMDLCVPHGEHCDLPVNEIRVEIVE